MIPDLPLMTQAPTAERPLAGLTLLLVEDSRSASEAIRLLSLRSGARIRRADCLRSARRHLQVYRPGVLIVDMGLPDGAGSELIAELARAPDGPRAILGLSGDPDTEVEARAAGATGFLAKPVMALSVFQSAVLAGIPDHVHPRAPRALSDHSVPCDPEALAIDLLDAAGRLDEAVASGEYRYLAHFLKGVGLTAGDRELSEIARDLLSEPSRDAAIRRFETRLAKRRV